MRYYSTTSACLLTTLVIAFTASPSFCDATNGKAAPPDAKAQKEAIKLVQDVYKDNIAKAEKPEEKVALAKEFLQAGVDEKKDAVARYVLFMLAKDTAAKAGDLETACKAVDAVDKEYEIDALKIKSDVAVSAGKSVQTADLGAFVLQAMSLVDQAVASDRYDIAKQLTDLTSTAAKRTPGLIKQVEVQSRRVRELDVAYADIRKAKAVLAQRPVDPDANLKVGKFQCFVKGGWQSGLSMLALGNDNALRALAEKELKGATSADEQMKLADGWWDFAETASALEKKMGRARASFWYKQAAPQLSGLQHTKAEKRAAEGSPVTPMVDRNETTTVDSGEKTAVGKNDAGWTILFRSADPKIWNTSVRRNQNNFSVKLADAPDGTNWLRLSILNSDKFVIIPMKKNLLTGNFWFGQTGYAWNGSLTFSYGASHLGICSRDLGADRKGLVCITHDVSNKRGWGFGHYFGLNSQAFSWNGEALTGPVTFEIAVKSDPLTETEQKALLFQGTIPK